MLTRKFIKGKPRKLANVRIYTATIQLSLATEIKVRSFRFLQGHVFCYRKLQLKQTQHNFNTFVQKSLQIFSVEPVYN